MANERRNKDGLTKSDRQRILDRFIKKEANIVFCGKKSAHLIAYYNEISVTNPKISAEYLTITDIDRAIKRRQSEMPKNETKEEKRFRMMVACSSYYNRFENDETSETRIESLNKNFGFSKKEITEMKKEFEKIDKKKRGTVGTKNQHEFDAWIKKVTSDAQHVNKEEFNSNRLKDLKNEMIKRKKNSR